MSILGYFGDKFTSLKSAMTKTGAKVGGQIITLLEQLGFKKPRNREEKLELLNEVKEGIEEEIERLEEQEGNNEADEQLS